MICFLEELVHYGDASPYIYSHSAFLSLTMNSDFTVKPRSFAGSFPCHATRERDTERQRHREKAALSLDFNPHKISGTDREQTVN